MKATFTSFILLMLSSSGKKNQEKNPFFQQDLKDSRVICFASQLSLLLKTRLILGTRTKVDRNVNMAYSTHLSVTLAFLEKPSFSFSASFVLAFDIILHCKQAERVEG